MVDTFYTAGLKDKLKPKIPNLLIIAGLVLVLGATLILVLTFYPVFKTETEYFVKGPLQGSQEITPIDTEFGIVIPKIRANSKIIADVNPYNEKEYQWALTKGVAHAKGTALPEQSGNVFIFSHSSANFYEAQRYNSIFYLLYKMEKGDEIDLYRGGRKFKYLVTEKKTVAAEDVKYLSGDGSKKTVTLMTCWPPGTTYKRLLVIGELSEN